MSFSSALQGRAAHEALLQRQDAELRLLDTMKRSLLQKVKCDKEYALQLSAVAQHGLKFERGDELQGSHITKAWRAYMDDCEQTARQLKENAELLETLCKERLTQLHHEKQRARKAYQEEHSRLATLFHNLNEDVLRKKADYQKNLDYYKALRSRFEDHYVKSGRGGRKLDDVRDKYQKACRKLHLAHNEYVLLISEAADVENDIRTILLPGILEYQETLQENFIGVWKGILLDVARHGDWTADRFQEIKRQIDQSLRICNPSDEYREFIERHKSSPPSPVLIQFDQTLSEDSLGNKLQPNTLTVDNLTVDWLRNRLGDIESSIKECQDKQSRLMATEALASTAANHTTTNGSLNTSTSSSSAYNTQSAHSKELNTLRCQERQLLKSADMIRTSLNDVGCEELPSGCDDLSVDIIENVVDASGIQPGSPISAAYLRRKGAHMFGLLRTPFRRKSKAVAGGRISGNASTTSGSFSPKATTPLGVRCSSVPRSFGSDVKAKEVVGGGQMTLATNRPLYEEEWFHGVLPREEVVRLLKNDGDFLVRETIRNDESQIVLSVCWNGHKHFIVQTTAEGHFRFEGPFFASIQELIQHQHLSESPVTGRSGAVLKTPITRERWELSNDDVILQDKIGRGNFGDVYKARLKSAKNQVAVKTCRMTLPDEQKRKFLQEGRILKQYDHPNIVKLIGICVQKQPIMIVMELVPGGSLLNFLRKSAAALNTKQLMGMCRDAAAGMRYLESKNCIHRDLAARNCLIGYDNIVKISDFGMSREEEEYIVSDGMKQIPIKWTAPEALNFGKYTTLCDVWSYGILMWEIFSKGDTPYTGMSNSRARERIDSGYRMPIPEHTPPEMYRLMVKCWAYEPEARPHFDEIHTVVDALLLNRD